MTFTRPAPIQATEERQRIGERDGSVGELVSAVTADAQTLFRQEVELARTEVREEAVNAGKAAGMYGGAGFAGTMVAVFLSLTGVFALANVMDEVWAAMIVAGAWAVIGAALFALGRTRMRHVSARPDKTIQTLKENARWARHPSS
jgi:hypothetical protein